MADYAGGWDTGAVYSSRVYAGEPQDHSREDVDRKFASFLRSFRLDNIFVYREQLRQNLILGNHFLEVDMAHIVRFDEQLASHMKVRPKEYLPIFEDAVRKVATEAAMGVDDVLPRFQIMLISRANPVPIRDLDTPFISKLVRVAGIVISANSLQSKATSIQITCRSCRHTKNLDVDTGLAGVSLPMNCEAYRRANTGRQTQSMCGPNVRGIRMLFSTIVQPLSTCKCSNCRSHTRWSR